MINHIIPIIVVFALILVGFLIKRNRIAVYNQRCEYTFKFNNTFFDMANDLFTTFRFDNQKYSLVIRDIDKIQEELGADGVLSEFIDPLKGVKGRNYQLFMNIMPEIRSAVSMDNSIMRERINQLIGLCEDALKRHIGNLERAMELEKKNLYNPITCLGEGIRWIVYLPVDILNWLGILSVNRGEKIKANIIFRVISNVIVFIGLISSIFTIILGWDDFLLILNRWIK